MANFSNRNDSDNIDVISIISIKVIKISLCIDMKKKEKKKEYQHHYQEDLFLSQTRPLKTKLTQLFSTIEKQDYPILCAK